MHSRKIIPDQYIGAQSATSYAIKTANSVEADCLFEKAKQNLLDVNRWQELAGPSTAKFTIVNKNNKEINGLADEGNFLRISIPIIPKTETGEGFDWVKVERIEERKSAGYRFIGMRVRPCKPPFEKNEVAHFFSADATSTFCIEQKGNKVKAAVYGRNEKPNTKKAFGPVTILRNLLIALAAMMGFNKPQWKSLVTGLMNDALNRDEKIQKERDLIRR